MNDCIKSNLPGFLYTFIMFWNLFFTPALFLGVMGYARFLFLSFVLSQWLMIQGTSESKILAGSGCFVRFSYFMYVTCCRLALFQTFIPCFRWFQIVCECLQMFLRWLLNFLRWLQVVVDGFRWFQVVLGRSMFQ